MKYVCRICGFVHDEAAGNVPFAELSDTWVCPICGAKKRDFAPQTDEPTEKAEGSRVTIDRDMEKLSPSQLSALCSNLARGCEKQYKPRESALFTQLAEYFHSVTPEIPDKGVGDISAMLESDLNELYQNAKSVAGEAGDRGALRVCVWGEKVTRILTGLMERYAEEGDAFLEGTEIWVCSVCGFVYVGDRAPSLCPVCKVPDWKFDKIEGGVMA